MFNVFWILIAATCVGIGLKVGDFIGSFIIEAIGRVLVYMLKKYAAAGDADAREQCGKLGIEYGDTNNVVKNKIGFRID